MNDRTTIEIKRDTKKRIDRVKAELQVNYDVLINQMCEAYENKYRCEMEGLERE